MPAGCRALACLVVLVACPSLAVSGPVSGTVRIVTRAGVAPATAIVYAEPIDSAPPRTAGRLTLAQRNKTFLPHVLAVPVGSTVAFPNNDQIFHNVFSLAGPQPFDLGLYRAGATRERRFTRPGRYRVFCNIHPQMTALVIVVPTPHTATVGADGRFVLDLPPGRYRVTALSERAAPVSVEVTSVEGAATAPALTLDESGWIFAQHKNKFGQDYPAAAYKR
ncbi:MAG: cupredoxin domain-containing protein [Vicinamibacterales bacterium]